MPKKEDIDEIIEIDLSDIKLISTNTRIKLNTKNSKDEDVVYTLRPVSTMMYYDYLESEESEDISRSKLIHRCLVDPEMSVEEIRELPVRTFKLLFSYLMEYSYLKKTNQEE